MDVEIERIGDELRIRPARRSPEDALAKFARCYVGEAERQST